jgi:glycosyltransferase involved in cell wall biosynthesis
MNIHYISHGPHKSGGYQHESRLLSACTQYFETTQTVNTKTFRQEKLFETWLDYWYLLIWAFFKSDGDINITTARTALPAIWRNKFNKKQVWVVLHNYDEQDGKSWLMKTYYKLLFRFLSKNKDPRFKLITVAPYWQHYFQTEKKIPFVYWFPNLFELDIYKDVGNQKKNKWIHLGQFSSKNDPAIITLAARLNKAGYYCYFSTLDERQHRIDRNNYDVVKFDNFTDYLDSMARCECTLALSRVKEGWNRVAHESLLLGTPVLGFKSGGLGDLLKESNSIIVNSVDEAYTCITEKLWMQADEDFLLKYDISNGINWMKTICQS